MNRKYIEAFGQSFSVEELREAMREVVREELDKALAQLPANARRVLELRFGIRDAKPRHLSEVAAEMGLTLEQVKQLERQAIQALTQLKAQTQD
jgi:RNA polymerase sigma factor (sigma-70 family)